MQMKKSDVVVENMVLLLRRRRRRRLLNPELRKFNEMSAFRSLSVCWKC